MAVTATQLNAMNMGLRLTAPTTTVDVLSLDLVSGVVTSTYFTDPAVTLFLQSVAENLFLLVPVAERPAAALQLLTRLVNVSRLDASTLSLSAVNTAGDIYALRATVTAAPANLVAHLTHSIVGGMSGGGGYGGGALPIGPAGGVLAYTDSYYPNPTGLAGIDESGIPHIRIKNSGGAGGVIMQPQLSAVEDILKIKGADAISGVGRASFIQFSPASGDDGGWVNIDAGAGLNAANGGRIRLAPEDARVLSLGPTSASVAEASRTKTFVNNPIICNGRSLTVTAGMVVGGDSEGLGRVIMMNNAGAVTLDTTTPVALPVTNEVNYYRAMVITLVAHPLAAGDTTVPRNAVNMKLLGGTDYNMAPGTSLTIAYFSALGPGWFEIGRSNPFS